MVSKKRRMYDSWDHDTQISTAASMKVHHMSLLLVCFTSAPWNDGGKEGSKQQPR